MFCLMYLSGPEMAFVEVVVVLEIFSASFEDSLGWFERFQKVSFTFLRIPPVALYVGFVILCS